MTRSPDRINTKTLIPTRFHTVLLKFLSCDANDAFSDALATIPQNKLRSCDLTCLAQTGECLIPALGAGENSASDLPAHVELLSVGKHPAYSFKRDLHTDQGSRINAVGNHSCGLIDDGGDIKIVSAQTR